MPILQHIISNIYDKNKIKNINNIPNLNNSMLTIEKKLLIDNINKSILPKNEINQQYKPIIEFQTDVPNKYNHMNAYFLPKQKDTLFWCLYILKYGINDYNNISNYGITELSEKEKCLKFIDNNVSLIKTSNFRITNLNIKEIKSELLTVQTSTSYNVLISFIFFYKFNIYLLHNNNLMYIKFTNDINDINHIIIRDKNKFRIYKTNASQEDIINFSKKRYCFNHFDKPIKGVSTYKVSELNDIANIFNIDINVKKQELYDSIRMQLIWDDR
jgi:hypothetical protein